MGEISGEISLALYIWFFCIVGIWRNDVVYEEWIKGGLIY